MPVFRCFGVLSSRFNNSIKSKCKGNKFFVSHNTEKGKIQVGNQEKPSGSDTGIIGRNFCQEGICVVLVSNNVCGKAVGYHQIRSMESVIVGSYLVDGLLGEFYFLSLALNKHERLQIFVVNKYIETPQHRIDPQTPLHCHGGFGISVSLYQGADTILSNFLLGSQFDVLFSYDIEYLHLFVAFACSCLSAAAVIEAFQSLGFDFVDVLIAEAITEIECYGSTIRSSEIECHIIVGDCLALTPHCAENVGETKRKRSLLVKRLLYRYI